jgi:arsenate reductase (thioredoxin)
MAAALLERYAGGQIRIRSAGSAPADRLNPEVERAMAEVGIDLAGRSPALLSDDAVQEADVVVTMGCGDACPFHPGKRYVDWELPDPDGKRLEDIRPIRDEIDRRVRTLAAELLSEASNAR